MNEKTLKVFAEEPLFEPFLQGWQLQSRSNAFLLSFLAIEPELEEKTRGYIIHTIINWFCRSEMILIYTPLREWFPVYELFGFEPLLWADAKSESGCSFVRLHLISQRKIS